MSLTQVDPGGGTPLPRYGWDEAFYLCPLPRCRQLAAAFMLTCTTTVLPRHVTFVRYTCHCIETSNKATATSTAEFLNAAIEVDHGSASASGGGAAGHPGTKAATFQFGAKRGSVRDDEESARLRKREGLFNGDVRTSNPNP